MSEFEIIEDSMPEGAVFPGKKKKEGQSLSVYSGREVPNNPEAEINLLSCIMQDEGVLHQCAEALLTSRSFYNPRHQIIFESIEEIWGNNGTIEVFAVCQELNKIGALADAGGAVYLNKVANAASTTAYSQSYINALKKDELLRTMITQSASIIEKALSNDGDAAFDLWKRANSIIDGGMDVSEKLTPITAFHTPRDDDDDWLLGANRYLNRGDSLILSSSSGMGKTSLNIVMAIHWGIGRPFMGIKSNGALKQIILQAEDSDGDIGEVYDSCVERMNLSEEEIETLTKNVILRREKELYGARFLMQIKRLARKHKPDVIWINPLHNYVDGSISDEKDAKQFLMGLNSVNNESKFAYIVVHHTAKPPKEQQEKKWSDWMYDMYGSSTLTNWARAVIILSAKKESGKFDLILAKRGLRAGVRAPRITKEYGGIEGEVLEVVTQIPIEHAKGMMSVPGRKLKIPVIFWEQSSIIEEKRRERRETGREKRGKTATFEEEKILEYFPKIGEGENGQVGSPIASISKKAVDCFGFSKSTFHRLKMKLVQDKKIQEAQGMWYKL